MGHPERPERLSAVLDGIDAAVLGEAVVRVEPPRPGGRSSKGSIPPVTWTR
jgi:hypothetical protein